MVVANSVPPKRDAVSLTRTSVGRSTCPPRNIKSLPITGDTTVKTESFVDSAVITTLIGYLKKPLMLRIRSVPSDSINCFCMFPQEFRVCVAIYDATVLILRALVVFQPLSMWLYTATAYSIAGTLPEKPCVDNEDSPPQL